MKIYIDKMVRGQMVHVYAGRITKSGQNFIADSNYPNPDFPNPMKFWSESGARLSLELDATLRA